MSDNSYVVVARKWRPQNFANIAGQEHITHTLQNAIKAGRIAHAYLFTGVRGVGKTTAARILAKALNCEEGPTPDPCNRCSHCQEITNGNSIDVLEIDGASNRGIDEIRQIIENVRYHPAQSRFKIYIIDEVHQVTRDAFNALLKTLEEPPPSVKFILATTEPHRLPETIISRCQRFDFRLISSREIVQRLDEIVRNEGLEVTEGALVSLARESGGSMRDAQSLLEQVLAWATPSQGKKARVDEQMLHEILGLAHREALYQLSRAIIAGDARQCLERIGDLVAQGRDLSRLSRDLVEHFRNLLVARLMADGSGGVREQDLEPMGRGQLLDLPEHEIADLRAQVNGLALETLLDYFDFMTAGDEDVARSANPRFALETALVRLAILPKTLPVSELIERIGRLEKKVAGEVKVEATPAKDKLSRGSPHPVQPENTEVNPASDRETVWRNFIAFVGKEKKLLASHLDSGNLLELLPGQLKIGFVERHHLNYLQDGDTLLMLKSLAQRFFSAEVAIDITAVPPRGAGSVGTALLDSGSNQIDENSDMVKEALRIFGGAVRIQRKENE